MEETYYGIKEKFRLIDFKSLLRLLMVLPNARRQEFAAVLHHFFAGDERLVAQIETNVTPKNILHTIARKSLEAERAAVTVAPSGVCCILSSLLPEPVYLRSCYIFTSLKTTSPTAHACISPLKQLRPEPPPSRVPPMTVNCFPCRASHVETERELTAPILLARLSL